MPDNSRDEAQLRKIMSALVEQFTKQLDLEKYCELFSEDTDWENAFGWRLRGRQRLMEFLKFLWQVQAGSSYGPINYRLEFLHPDVALVEYAFERIPPPNSPLAKRLVCATHILRKEKGVWQVALTRIWDPQTPPVPTPVQMFPEFKDAPLSGMRPLT